MWFVPTPIFFWKLRNSRIQLKPKNGLSTCLHKRIRLARRRSLCLLIQPTPVLLLVVLVVVVVVKLNNKRARNNNKKHYSSPPSIFCRCSPHRCKHNETYHQTTVHSRKLPVLLMFATRASFAIRTCWDHGGCKLIGYGVDEPELNAKRPTNTVMNVTLGYHYLRTCTGRRQEQTRDERQQL